MFGHCIAYLCLLQKSDAKFREIGTLNCQLSDELHPDIYSRSNLNSSVNFKSYLVIGNLTMIKTNCYNVSHTQRPIDDRFEFCKKREY